MARASLSCPIAMVGAASYIVPVGGGEPSVVSTGDSVPLALAWSPDGRSIGFTAAVPADRAAAAWAPPELLGLLRPPPPEVELFVVSVGGGAPRQLSHGGFTCAASRRGRPRATGY
jgi:Tol biopolymer transport system component